MKILVVVLVLVFSVFIANQLNANRALRRTRRRDDICDEFKVKEIQGVAGARG